MYNVVFDRPGAGLPEEYLHFMSPASHVLTNSYAVNSSDATVIPPIENRKNILIQAFETDFWVLFGGENAEPGNGFKLLKDAVIGLDIMSNVPVSIIAGSGSGHVIVIQMGG